MPDDAAPPGSAPPGSATWGAADPALPPDERPPLLPEIRAYFAHRHAETPTRLRGQPPDEVAAEFRDYWEARDWTDPKRKKNNGLITGADYKRHAATWFRQAKHNHAYAPRNAPRQEGDLARDYARNAAIVGAALAGLDGVG